MVLPLQLIPRDMMRDSAGLTNMSQHKQPKSQMYMPHMPLVLHRQVSLLRVEPPAHFYIMCYSVCFQVPMWLPCSSKGAQPLGFATLQLFRVYPWQAYVPRSDGLWPTPGVKSGCSSHFLELGESSAAHLVVPSLSSNIVGHTALGASQSHLIPQPSLHGSEESSFLCSAASDDTVNSESMVGVKPGDSGFMVGCQVDELSAQYWEELQPDSPTYTKFPNLLYTAELCK